MGIRISEMEEATSFTEEDYVPIVSSGTNKKALGTKIKDFIASFFVSKADFAPIEESSLITSLGTTFTDCNTVLTPGMYYASLGSVTNAPEGIMSSNNACQLIVMRRGSDARVFQILIAYIGTGAKTRMYMRAQNGATSFAAWKAADYIPYDNTTSGLSANDVQGAIDEVASKVVIQNGSIIAKSGITLNEVKVKRFGDLVYVKFYATASSGLGAGNVDIATLTGVPFPSQHTRFTCSSGVHAYDAINSAYGIINTNGTISVQLSNTNNPIVIINTIYYIN